MPGAHGRRRSLRDQVGFRIGKNASVAVEATSMRLPKQTNITHARSHRPLHCQRPRALSRARVHPLVSCPRAVPDVLHERHAARGVSGDLSRLSGREPAEELPRLDARAPARGARRLVPDRVGTAADRERRASRQCSIPAARVLRRRVAALGSFEVRRPDRGGVRRAVRPRCAGARRAGPAAGASARSHTGTHRRLHRQHRRKHRRHSALHGMLMVAAGTNVVVRRRPGGNRLFSEAHRPCVDGGLRGDVGGDPAAPVRRRVAGQRAFRHDARILVSVLSDPLRRRATHHHRESDRPPADALPRRSVPRVRAAASVQSGRRARALRGSPRDRRGIRQRCQPGAAVGRCARRCHRDRSGDLRSRPARSSRSSLRGSQGHCTSG